MAELGKQIVPLLIGALTVIIPAVATAVRAWISMRQAQFEAQRQAALGAAFQVEVESVLDGSKGPAKFARATELATERLPIKLRPSPKRAAEIVQGAVEQVKRETQRPPPQALQDTLTTVS